MCVPYTKYEKYEWSVYVGKFTEAAWACGSYIWLEDIILTVAKLYALAGSSLTLSVGVGCCD